MACVAFPFGAGPVKGIDSGTRQTPLFVGRVLALCAYVASRLKLGGTAVFMPSHVDRGMAFYIFKKLYVNKRKEST